MVFKVFGDAMSVHQSSVSRAIAGVTEALYRKVLTEVKMPSGLQQRTTVLGKIVRKASFYKMIGDDTHIAIKTPSQNVHLDINCKGYHSINCQVV